MLMIMEKSQNFTYYAGIMLDAIAILLCSKLCWHNWLKPTAWPGNLGPLTDHPSIRGRQTGP